MKWEKRHRNFIARNSIVELASWLLRKGFTNLGLELSRLKEMIRFNPTKMTNPCLFRCSIIKTSVIKRQMRPSKGMSYTTSYHLALPPLTK